MDKKTRELVLKKIKEGKSLVDIVIENGVPPEIVEKVYREAMEEQLDNGKSSEIPDGLVTLFLIAVLVTTLDIFTTKIALAHPYTYEVNPIMDFLMKVFGVNYALMANIFLSFFGLFILTLLSVKFLEGKSVYLPLILYIFLRMIPVIMNYRILVYLIR